MTSIRTTLASTAALAATAMAASPTFADNATAEKFAAERLAAFGSGDWATLVAQYTEDATVITPAGVLHGRDQIKGMIEGIIGEFAQSGVTFELLSQHAVGPIVSFTWTAQTASNDYRLGAETYVLEDGLATFQTFAASVTPLSAR